MIKIVNNILSVIMIVGVIILIGTSGSIEIDVISYHRALLQTVIGVIFVAGGMILKNIIAEVYDDGKNHI